MRILVTGSRGFIGTNLAVRLREMPKTEVLDFRRGDSIGSLEALTAGVDAVVHLAGVNRPHVQEEFDRENRELTRALCVAIQNAKRKIPLILASSAQAETDNAYGRSKRAAELEVQQLAAVNGNAVTIYRLPGVFGKFCRPNYNSVVATFCYSIANDQPIQIRDPAALVNLVYVDDVVSDFIIALGKSTHGVQWPNVEPVYSVTLGDLARSLEAFRDSRRSLMSARVGDGLMRALYATYISYLPPAKFAYSIPHHPDERGVFVEMLKTPDCGQFSFFTARPGATRGGHYHHTKTEKFLVIKGAARFAFRHIVTGEYHEILSSGETPQVVETIPGWAHDVTNMGSDDLIVMLWANEVFDRTRPDTIRHMV